MFTREELLVIRQTLSQKRAWISKSIANNDLNKAELEQDLLAIDSVLQKITHQLKPSNDDRNIVNHYISEKILPPLRQAAITRRNELAPGHIRVLVVDDDQALCDLIALYLNSVGIQLVDFANDGMRAINMMYEAHPIYNLVLCDWNMPSKSGIEVHTAMRAAERYLGTAFILVTAVSEAKQIRMAIDDGVDDYLVKPIEQSKLLKKIARFFPQVKVAG